MLLYFIRHGQTDWNKDMRMQGQSDIPLNENGRESAIEAGKTLANTHIDLAFSSPLKRAKETAEILLEGRNIPLYEDQRIQEISFGSYEGMSCVDKTKEENLAFQKFFQDTGNYIPPEDAESVEQLYERTGEFLKSLEESKKLKDKNLLISTHGAAMTAMLNRMRGSLSVEHFWKNEVPPNCSVTIAELEGSGFKIIREGIIFYKEEVKHWKAV